MNRCSSALSLPGCLIRHLCLLLVGVVMAACGQSAVPVDPVPDGGASDVNGPDDSVADSTADTGLDSGPDTATDTKEDTADADATATADCPDPGHYDPPQFPYSCTGLNSYISYDPIWTNKCSDDCCWSEPGIANVPKFCPAGTVCTKPTSPQSQPCQPADCTTDADCQADERCTFVSLSCGPTGTGACVPAACPKDMEGQIFGQFCDCNGKTWNTPCKAWEAGASAVHDGPCCDPQKFGIPPENPAGFTQLELCGTPKAWMDGGLLKLPQGWKSAAKSERCGANAFVTDLPLAATGTALDPAGYLALCSLVADSGVAGAGGLGGATCQDVALAPLPDCIQGCTALCGCTVNKSPKPDICDLTGGKYGIWQQKGWCAGVLPCQEGQVCTAPDGVPFCTDL